MTYINPSNHINPVNILLIKPVLINYNPHGISINMTSVVLIADQYIKLNKGAICNQTVTHDIPHI